MRTRLPKDASRDGAAVSIRRSRAVLSIFALGAFAVLIGLGLWQLERRTWKNDLIRRFEHALQKPPVAFDAAHSAASSGVGEFTRVEATGTFLNDRTIKVLTPTPQDLRAKTPEGFGYLLFVPLRVEDGLVFVNRGFVPETLAGSASVQAQGEVTVVGILRRPEQPGWFTPPPNEAKRVFYAADIPGMAAAVGIAGSQTLTTLYIQAESAQSQGPWPKPRDPQDLLSGIPNRHLEYALTWFGLAATLAVVYGFAIYRS